MNYKINYICISDIGKRRSENQDNYCCGGNSLDRKYTLQSGAYVPISGSIDSRQPEVIGVFDGMGGEQCGDIASMIAADTAKAAEMTGDPESDLLKICHSANAEICRFVEDHHLRCMGTTAAIAVFGKDSITICNIGDSRIYLVSDGCMRQISLDHTEPVPYLAKPPLTQNLGLPEDDQAIEPYIAKGVYEDGDRFLFCTDGLTDMLSDEEIIGIINNAVLEEAAKSLVDTALEKGGRDNITIILCEIREENRNLLQTIIRTMTA